MERLSSFFYRKSSLAAKRNPPQQAAGFSAHARSVHGLAHLFDVLNGGNSLPLGIPGAAGEQAPASRNILPYHLDRAVFGPDGCPLWSFMAVQVDGANARVILPPWAFPAHEAKATPVSASKSPCRASPRRRAVCGFTVL